jgi:precorrin-6A synthase
VTRRILVIGIGAGDPDDLTLKAVAALNRADVFFLLDKGTTTRELTDLRREIIARHVTGPYRVVGIADPERDRASPAYTAAVDDWRARRAALIEEAIATELGTDGCGAFLVWGDPALYDSTIAIVDDLLARGNVAFEHTVVPGISSVAALAAAHRVSLTRVGRPVQVTTGRLVADEGLPVDDVVVMLDARTAFTTVPGDTEIFWGAYLGTPDEILVSGTVAEVGERIVTARAEARRRKGWIMDTYLLRRSTQSPQ